MNNPSATSFDPKIAFSRNLGWLTESDQEKIFNLTVGIVGMGGVGGQYSEIMARLGVGQFVIYDGDTFATENSNRQNECKVSNYGKNKAEVIANAILDINPKAKVTFHKTFIQKNEIDNFCKSIDIYLDGIDFFEFETRSQIFRKMRELGKPAITVAPIGAGTACVVFTKDSMSFDDYFGLHTTDNLAKKSILFVQGLAPIPSHMGYMVDRSYTKFEQRKVPSLPIGVYAAAAHMAATVLKVALQRGPVYAAPWTLQFDYYTLKFKKRYIFWGYRNPLQRIMHKIIMLSFTKK